MLRRPLESTQYLSIRYTERLAEAGIEPSAGSVGDSYDNALAETIIGLYKTEVIRRCGPWRNLEEVEFATLEWVDWFNNRRLFGPLGNIPPAEFEALYDGTSRESGYGGQTQLNESPENPGRFSRHNNPPHHRASLSDCAPRSEENQIRARKGHVSGVLAHLGDQDGGGPPEPSSRVCVLLPGPSPS